MKITVYRIEHTKTKQGPYQGVDSYRAWAVNNHNAKCRPTPTEDNKLREVWSKLNNEQQDKFKFGFSTKKGLLRWFSEKEISKLKQLNFNVVKYKVDAKNVVKGERQVIFKLS